jgi:benzodiazapine receptor
MDRVKPNYIVIPLLVILVAYVGGRLTALGIDSGWYDAIAKPSWTPPGGAIGIVWTIIFILTAAAALLVWNRAPRDARFRVVMALFVINAFCNVLWSAVFFGLGAVGWAVFDAAALGATVIALIALLYPVLRPAALLLVPYAAWVLFATFLNYAVWTMNP